MTLSLLMLCFWSSRSNDADLNLSFVALNSIKGAIPASSALDCCNSPLSYKPPQVIDGIAGWIS